MSEERIKVAVACFAHDGAGNFAFHKRGKHVRNHVGEWDSGGGGLEWGEYPSVAVLRELKEEYGCSGTIDEALTPTSFADEDGTWWVVLPFIISVRREDVYLAEPDKAEELRWVKLSEVPQPIHPGVAQDLVTFKEELQKYCL